MVERKAVFLYYVKEVPSSEGGRRLEDPHSGNF